MDTQTAESTPAAALAASKRCFYCGGNFNPVSRKDGEVRKSVHGEPGFCSPVCASAHKNLRTVRGKSMAMLVMAEKATRHALPGTIEAEVCRYAQTELTRMAKAYNDEDRAAGRPGAVEYVKWLMDSGTLWADRAGR